jgi:hypothetical protein
MLPKAEVPTKPLRERFDSPVTEEAFLKLMLVEDL